MIKNLKNELHCPVDTVAGRTALYRQQESAVARFLVERQLLRGPVFDWGCGHGKDIEFFISSGLEAVGWDPVHFPQRPPSSYEQGTFQWVHCAYVLNVIADPTQRLKVIQDIYEFLPFGGHLSLAVRRELDLKRKRKSTWKHLNDGWITNTGSFQKGFAVNEIVSLTRHCFQKVSVVSTNPIVVIAEK